MNKNDVTNYETYKEIMGELLSPILGENLDNETLMHLYESKMVYLENLRIKCFREINKEKNSLFTIEDYKLILESIQKTQSHLKSIVLITINNNLSKLKVG